MNQRKRLGIRQRWQITDKDVDAIRDAFSRSERSATLRTRQDVEDRFDVPAIGSLRDALYDRLRGILAMHSHTGFDTHDLRAIAGAFSVEHAIEATDEDRAAPLLLILACTQAGAQLPKPQNTIWQDAVTIGRALFVIDAYFRRDPRHEEVAAAAGRLHRGGYKVSLKYGRPWMAHSELVKVTSAIGKLLSKLGMANVLGNIASQMRADDSYHFDQYLTGRRYSPSGRLPSLPYGFLVNLAVTLPDSAVEASDPALNWANAVALARDLVATLDVEPQNQFWTINLASKRLDAQLREVGLYDHLFGLRQWSIYVTPLVLTNFVGTECDGALQETHGWVLQDAVKLCEAVIVKARTDPARLTRRDLQATGLTDAQLDCLLPHFVHASRKVNVGYRSPLCAEAADLMFRPMIEVSGGDFLVPAASLAGPAFYEATMAAVRAAVSKSVVARVTGDGTEKVTGELFRKAGLPPTFTSAKYNVGKRDEGECDLVLESDSHIVFVECKAKAMTRAAMSGTKGAGIEVYVGGVLNAQSQCLQHERLLRSEGHIRFEDGRRLELRDREIVRLSVTLLDHGTLQDASFFWALAQTLCRSRKSALKKVMSKIRAELDLIRAFGRADVVSVLSAAFLSVGQLAIVLADAKSLKQFVDRVNSRTTTNSGNPLLEYRHLRSRQPTV